MPVLASQTVKIDVKEDKSIKVLLLEKFKKSNCVNLPSLSSDKDELMEARNVARQLVGEKVITCDDDTCCISDNYFNFVKKLGGLK